MTRPVPEHGSWARYLGCKSRPACRCTVCVRETRRLRKFEEVRRARGISGHVPSVPTGDRLRKLLRRGRSVEGIARETGVDQTTIRRILTGATEEIWRSTAERLAKASAAPDPKKLVDALGTVRRLQALVAMGHGQDVLAAEVGCAYTYISMLTHGKRSQVTVALRQDVRRVYAHHSMQFGLSKHAQQRARRLGWYGPLAWDDDTIDDPNAVPQTDAAPAGYTEGDDVVDRFLMGESVVLTQAGRRQALVHLMEWSSQTPEQIGARLDMSGEATSRSWERVKDKARKDGTRVPWRRVYVPAVREHTPAADRCQDEMRSAA